MPRSSMEKSVQNETHMMAHASKLKSMGERMDLVEYLTFDSDSVRYCTGGGSFRDAVPGHHGRRPRLGGGDPGGPGRGTAAAAALPAQVPAAPGYAPVVVLAAVVGVEELLEPLEELKIVLELLFGQLVYINCLRGRISGYFNISISK